MNQLKDVCKKAFYLLSLGLAASFLVTAQPATVKKTSDVPLLQYLNITPFGFIKSWRNTTDPLGKTIKYTEFNSLAANDSADIGIFWWDARDVQGLEVIYQTALAGNTMMPVVQYWHDSWPETPPKMPSKEDLEDDPWQGKWITAATDIKVEGKKLRISFKSLAAKENPAAAYLPGEITYRRTLKIRLVYPAKHPPLASLQIFSASAQKSSSIRIALIDTINKSATVEGNLEIFNGTLKKISPWNWDKKDKKTGGSSFKFSLDDNPRGLIVHIDAAAECLPGSNDETVITFRSPKRTFSFSLDDVDKGPVFIPYFNAYITKADDPFTFSKTTTVKGKTVRQRILEEPEQSYDRARKEIPALDPTNRVGGGNIDLPLAADASWQKFAVQWGGNILLDKVETKAQGAELLRCNWKGKDLRWSIGTGRDPIFRRTKENCQMSVMNDYLPVIQSAWNNSGLNYREEAFATLLNGPLSPVDKERDEQTPAILMVKLTVSNPANKVDTAHVWLSGNKALTNLTKTNDFLVDEVNGANYIRCYMQALSASLEKTDILKDTTGASRILHRQITLGPNSSQTLYFYFPFVGDITTAQQKEIAALDYQLQKNRVTAYWRELVEAASIYNVPERKFNEMAKSIIPHIRMSVTKDPKSKLFLVPAAALSYRVYPNEAVFQTLLLDRLGDFKTSADYLNTFMELQGSSKLPGTFTGDQKDVFFGTRFDSIYNMTEENGYNMHHGAVLWGLARHYLYSNDREWLLKAAPHMIRAANWIIDQRAQTKLLDENGNKVMHYGLLPAGVLEDVHDWQFWYATNAYACMGLENMAKAFEKAGLPLADSFKIAAKAYHADIRQSLEKASELSPVVRLRNNTFVPYVPARPYQRFRNFGSRKSAYYDRYGKGIYPTLRLSATREALYGPIVSLKAGLIDADEPMADWVLDDWEDNLTLSSSMNLNAHGWVDDEYWFSRGGMVFQANLQNPVGIYLLRQEIPATIRGLYDNFVSCLFPDINAQTEEYREWGRGSGPFYKCPDEARFISQVCDLLVVQKNEELWLAAGTPRRWLEAGQRIELKKAQTEFGEVSYSLYPGKGSETIIADIQLPATACSKIVLFVRSPFQKPVRNVKINGQDWKEWDAVKESIVIPQTAKNVQVVVSY
ncbi:MAG: hypothetical protein ABIQ31_25425 [Ferruginibacter sp.]